MVKEETPGRVCRIARASSSPLPASRSASSARSRSPPTDQPWGERLAYFADPEGYPIHVTARLP